MAKIEGLRNVTRFKPHHAFGTSGPESFSFSRNIFAIDVLIRAFCSTSFQLISTQHTNTLTHIGMIETLYASHT